MFMDAVLVLVAALPWGARGMRENWLDPPSNVIRMIEVTSQYGKNRNFSVEFESCNPPCTQAPSVDHADVVYAYSGQSVPSRSHENQVWVGTFWESPEHYPPSSEDFDYSRSFRPDATFPHFEMIPSLVADMFDEKLERLRKDVQWPRRVSFAEKSKNPQQISVWISNCFVDSVHRLEMAAGLNDAGVPFASYGHCKHNADTGNSALLQVRSDAMAQFIQRTLREPNPRDRDMYDTSSKHLFFFAAENSNCAYYHTEKVYHGLLSGSIPVYVGNGDTIGGYVPKGSIIKASDFKSTNDLAEYLKKVASNETLYNSFFDWHGQNLRETSSAFREKLLTRQQGSEGSRCAECAFFHQHGRNKAFNGASLGCGV